MDPRFILVKTSKYKWKTTDMSCGVTLFHSIVSVIWFYTESGKHFQFVFIVLIDQFGVDFI